MWLLCFILTVAGAFPEDDTEYGYEARTDIRLDVLEKTSWIRFPYPGIYEPRHEKTCRRVFRPDRTQTGLYSHIRWLETKNFGSRKKSVCTIYVVKTKTLIICAVTAQLICAFVFAYMQKADFLITLLICTCIVTLYKTFGMVCGIRWCFPFYFT